MKDNTNNNLSKNAIIVALHRNNHNVTLLRIGNELDEVKSYYITSNTIGLDPYAILLSGQSAKIAEELIREEYLEIRSNLTLYLEGITPFTLSPKGKDWINTYSYAGN